MKNVLINKTLIILSVILFLLLDSGSLIAATESGKSPDVSYKILLYANNSLYRMNPDGSGREKLFEKADIIDFQSLSDGRILVHSSQYDGESLEIFEISSGVWSLVEFTEGDIPNIAVSENGITIAYEIRHFPISIDGDGVWLYDVSGKKSHAKIANTALTIESFTIFSGRLFLLYHELDLVSDEAGLFMESIPLDTSSKPRRNRVPEGLKMLIPEGYSIGFTYPASGKRLEITHLIDGISSSIAMPSGDIILHKNSYFPGEKPSLVFGRKAIDFVGKEYEEILLWDIDKNKLNPLKINERVEPGDFRWSPDGLLYFTAKYIDPSGELSSPMLFRMNIADNKIEIVSVLGGFFAFQAIKNPGI